jgi:uncharacterized protein (TIGR03437 family)
MRRSSFQLKLPLVLPASLLLLSGWFAASQSRALTTPRAVAATPPASNTTYANYGRLPLSFEANQGQAEAAVKFLARGGNGTLALSTTEAILALPSANVRLKLDGANPQPRLSGVEPLPGRVNYLHGRDPRQWQTEVPTYAKVRYAAVYPGVDWVFYGNQQQLEYDFIVAPNADPRAIRMRFAGVQGVQLNDAGELILQTAGGPVRQMRPYIYQEVAGVRREVTGSYKLRGAQEVCFEVGAYDRSRPLVIDPVLVFAARTLAGQSIAVDAQGSAYIINGINDQQFPSMFGLPDIVVSKLNPTGTAPVFTTVIGGNGGERATDLKVDVAGNVYVVGSTTSTDFPGAFPGGSPGSGASLLWRSADAAESWQSSGRGLPELLQNIRRIVVDPANPEHVYLSGGRPFRSINGGADWAEIGQDLGQRTLLNVVPGNPSTIYINNDGAFTRSTDGGLNWSQVEGVPQIGSVAYHPNNPQIIYASGAVGVAPEGTVYQSTDGGKTWIKRTVDVPNTGILYELVVDGSQSTTLYAFASTAGINSVIKSTDGGASWKQIRFDSATINNVTVDQAGLLYLSTSQGLFKSLDRSDTWQKLQLPGLANAAVSQVVLDPTNQNNLYVLLIRSNGVSLYKTTDGGTSWRALCNRFCDATVSAFSIDPKNPQRLYIGLDSSSSARFEGFAFKLDASGASLGYAQYLGGWQATSLALDGAGNTHIVGIGGPRVLRNGLTSGSDRSFLSKLSPQGEVLYASKLPGLAQRVAVDSAGQTYLAGTINPDESMLVRDGFRFSAEEQDIYAMKVDTQRSGDAALLYSTYIGGANSDYNPVIAVDSQGAFYLSLSSGGGFLISNVIAAPDPATFLLKLDPKQTSINSISWIRRSYEGVRAMAVDANGNTYLAGKTSSEDFPVTPGAWQTVSAGGKCGQILVCNPPPVMPCTCQLTPKPGCPIPTLVGNPCGEGFLLKYNATATALLYGTYLGASSTVDNVSALALDALGNVYLTGLGSVGQPTNSFTDPNGSGYVAKLTIPARLTSLTTLSAASFLGPVLAPASLAVSFLDAAGAGVEKLKVKITDAIGREVEAPVSYAGNGQVNFQITESVFASPSDVTVSVTSNGATIASGTIQIAKVAPGVFAANANGRGVPAAVILRLRVDGSSVYEPLARLDPATNRFVPAPIDLGPEGEQVILVLFGTGWRGRSDEQNVGVNVGGVTTPLLYAGVQPTIAGLDQINVRLPRALAGRGEVDVVVTADGKTANTVRVAIR